MRFGAVLALCVAQADAGSYALWLKLCSLRGTRALPLAIKALPYETRNLNPIPDPNPTLKRTLTPTQRICGAIYGGCAHQLRVPGRQQRSSLNRQPQRRLCLFGLPGVQHLRHGLWPAF